MANTGEKPCMNWQAANLDKEWRRFKQHCEFTFKGPLATKPKGQKVNYTMTYSEIDETFTWTPAMEDGPAEETTLRSVYNKYAQYVAPMKNQIRATVTFNRRKQDPREKFGNFITDLRILVKACGYAEEDRMLRDAIVLRSSRAAVREKYLEKGDELTLNMAISIRQNYETSQESMRPKVHVVNIRGRGKLRIPGRSRNWSQSRFYRDSAKNKVKNPQQQKCRKCGYNRMHERCPAKDSKCNYCHKKGHFASMCRNNAGSHIVEDMCGFQQSDDDSGAHLINRWIRHRNANRHRLHQISDAIQRIQRYELHYEDWY